MVVTIFNGECQQWWYVFFLVFVTFLIHHVCCVFELLLGVFSNLCWNFWSSCFLCFCVWTFGHHMLHGPTLVFNCWSSCSWCFYFSVQLLIIMFLWFLSCVSLMVIMLFVVLLLCLSFWLLCSCWFYLGAWTLSHCVFYGLALMLRFMVVVIFMVLLIHNAKRWHIWLNPWWVS